MQAYRPPVPGKVLITTDRPHQSWLVAPSMDRHDEAGMISLRRFHAL